MKQIRTIDRFLYLSFFSLIVCGSLVAVSPDDFNKLTVMNNLSTDTSIEYLFFSPGDSQYWGPDILEKNHILSKGKKSSFFVFYPDKSAIFDFMAIDSNGRIYEIDNIDVVDGKEKTVTLNDRNLTNRTIDKLPMAEVIVTNDTDQSLDFAYFSPGDSKIWGLEVLNSGRTLRAGEEASFLVLLAGERFDMEFLALGEDGTEYQKTLAIGTSQATLSMGVSAKDKAK